MTVVGETTHTAEDPRTGCARGLRVGIVGGSIGGCVAAIALARVGCEVSVFERSRAQFEDRGAGISSPLAHLEWLRAEGLIDADLPFVACEAVR